ncbi:hypothetical protein HU200_029380 [Digitaria exilis]|uniref:Bifunctional inhibitor/plant lipid transfer protein/seed storage helical domain-containing protein n=1 Tax=Digitaria exilis TaxID=1010633 RepID=A0A835BZ43_9POAL|nr:hypothetical protein HU200_029380 [Digitaria exilis]
MAPGKLALLLLVVFAVVSLHPVIGNKRKICTKIQKDNILKHCEEYTRYAGPAPSIHSPCCAAALEVPNLDMQCIIIDLLTADEKSKHNKNNIKELRCLCYPLTPTSPHKVRIGCVDNIIKYNFS